MIYIIIPFKNEVKVIQQTAKEVEDFCLKYILQEFKLIFINDGSTDGTDEELKRFRFITKPIFLTNKFDHGKGSALKVAYILAQERLIFNDNDIVIFMDSDGQIKPKEIKTFLKIMDFYDADIVIGNKRHLYSNIHYPPIRQIVSCAYNFIIRFLFGLSLRDTQCGLKIFKRYALDKVIEKVNVKRYAFDLELLVALNNSDFRIADAPVYVEKQMNAGSVSIKNIISTFIDTLIIFIKKKKGLYV